jgi:hypothetical protein
MSTNEDRQGALAFFLLGFSRIEWAGKGRGADQRRPLKRPCKSHLFDTSRQTAGLLAQRARPMNRPEER